MRSPEPIGWYGRSAVKRRIDSRSQAVAISDETPGNSSQENLAPTARTAPQRNKRGLLLWGALLLLIGAGLEAAAIAVWDTTTWPDVLVSVGAGAILAGFVMLLEPRLARDVGRAAGAMSADVAATTATEVATRVAEDRTRDLDERLSRVESAADIQDRVHVRIDEEAADRASRLRTEPTFTNVAAVFQDADDRSLFSEVWVKCGTQRSYLLEFEHRRYFRDGTLSHESVVMRLGKAAESEALLTPGTRLSTFAVVASVEWQSEESFEDAYRRFVREGDRNNQPVREVDFATAFAELARGYELMHRSRTATSRAARRPSEKLVLLVNDEWAITCDSQGRRLLEGLQPHPAPNTTTFLTSTAAQAPPLPTGYDASLWNEALFYAQYFPSIERPPSPPPRWR